MGIYAMITQATFSGRIRAQEKGGVWFVNPVINGPQESDRK